MSFTSLIAGSNGSISLAWTPIAPAGDVLTAIQTAPVLPGTGSLGGEMTSGTVNGSFVTGDVVVKIATFFLTDDGSIPSDATIVGVQIFSRVRAFNTGQPVVTGLTTGSLMIQGNGGNSDYVIPSFGFNGLGVLDGWYSENGAVSVSATYSNTYNPDDTSGFSVTGSVFNNNPLTSAAWTRAQLFSSKFGVGGKWNTGSSGWTAADKGIIFDRFLVQVQWTPAPPSLILTGSGGLKLSGGIIPGDPLSLSLVNLNTDGTGGIAIGSAAPLVLSVDASGIYTLVKNKTHDTLYERQSGITSVDVKIPNPFAKTGYFGG